MQIYLQQRLYCQRPETGRHELHQCAGTHSRHDRETGAGKRGAVEGHPGPSGDCGGFMAQGCGNQAAE